MESYDPKFIERQLKILSENVNAIVSSEIKARNRVDISLEEYEKLKDEIAEQNIKILNLSTENKELRLALKEIGIPINDVRVIPESINVRYSEIIGSSLKNKKACRVEFEFEPLS